MTELEKSATIEENEQLLQGSKRRYTRTRNGCERCRAQRRKCDEKRPRCGRCVNAGVDALCKYVMHVSFKNKNTQTLPNYVGPNSIGDPASLRNYHAIEFVVHDDPRPIDPPEHFSNTSDDRHCDHTELPIKTLKSFPSFNVTEGWPLVGQSLSIIEVELLKYYSHHVAPWLDIYDQSKTFGHCVPRLAMASPCLLEILLQVTAVFSGRPQEVVTRRGAGMFHLLAMSNPAGADSPLAALQMIACFVLARTLPFVDTIPDTWERNFHGIGAFRYFNKFDFLEETQRQIWVALLTLILRLEIAYYLMKEVKPDWILELACQIQTKFRTNCRTDQSQEILGASLQCLELLIDAMSFSFPMTQTSDKTTTPILSGASRFEKWKELVERLYAWHMGRPEDLKPLVELENPEDTFPTVIFTNGAGISSNVVYHAAMFLLLSNKSQPVSLDEQGRKLGIDATQMLPHWHAHRICGIAINSEPEYTNCWDPVTIAAFSLVARRMTHRSQQNDILNCFNRLKATGWRTDGLVDKLQGEWTFVI
ncbi:hypothetical protein EV127DRAFT_116719 [Xylaria flabelliformis]|nr:hypothetical protein EV127DRAFT_116719 [Xylaria flabelliformis]